MKQGTYLETSITSNERRESPQICSSAFECGFHELFAAFLHALFDALAGQVFAELISVVVIDVMEKAFCDLTRYMTHGLRSKCSAASIHKVSFTRMCVRFEVFQARIDNGAFLSSFYTAAAGFEAFCTCQRGR
jgi:hypothetical protein